ncbi:hypothetical protein OG497_37695 [Streptomyces sp. NBC_01242]|uniref:hypothetical protein n=1 Tax=Streptomyces sp. NBC_01242 TaxID=2903795 RepID=UPI0022507E86|nr:hypothetical protein [Streptomyces sp. NBC_01242]MCX4799592.1 hypothetical protein [Streptomyces sp. NBC_01242]
MPRPELFAVRSALDLTDKQSHRLLAFAAMDDITGYKRPRFQWSHPTLARQLGLNPHFVTLLQNYLQYRAARDISHEQSLRPHGDNVAQLFRVADDRPLDLIRMVASAQREAQLAALLGLGMALKVRVEGSVVLNIERSLGRSCGLAWEDLTAIYQRQRTAQKKEMFAA